MATTYKKIAPRTRKNRVTKSEVKLLYLKDASFLLKVHVTVGEGKAALLVHENLFAVITDC